MFIPSWLRSRLGRNLDSANAGSYNTCFGAPLGLALLVLCVIWPRAIGRKVRVSIPGSPVRLSVRLGSTDIAVFNDIFRAREYEWELGAPPRVIVDAGAYAGFSAAFFATRYPEAKIIAIEPGEQNFDLLVQNTASFANVHAIRAALWAESGMVSLTDPGNGAWGFRLSEAEYPECMPDRGDIQSIAASIQAMTVTDVIRDFGLDRIDLLKLDIEGSEKEVFANADSWIGQVQAICVELHDRFNPGCSRAFFNAVEAFPTELWRGEDVLVARDRSVESAST
jgi:FkbM family methyltransferase